MALIPVLRSIPQGKFSAVSGLAWPALFFAAVLLPWGSGCMGAALGTLAQSAAGSDVVSYNGWQAQSFSLSAAAGSYRVRRVTLHCQQVVPNASLVLRLTGSAGAVPNFSDVRASLTIPESLPSAAGPVAFIPAAAPDPVLLPGQTYWLVLGVTALDNEQPLPAGVFRWSYGAGAAADAPAAAGWTLGGQTATSGTAGSAWTAAANTPYLFSIDARPPVFAPPSQPFLEWSGGMPVAGARGTPGVEYEVESSATLASWTRAGSAFADAAGIIRFPDTAAASRRFYRFR
jgi:hypothetical protein